MKVKISNSRIGSNAVLINLFFFYPGVLSLLALFIVELKGALLTLIFFKISSNTITLFENLKSSCF